MLKNMDKLHDISATDKNKRRHPRHKVFKSALLYPVVEEVGLSVENISTYGISGQCALSLGLHQQVHVSFDEVIFNTAEVRWVNGKTCGLLLEDPILLIGGQQPVDAAAPEEHEPRDPRVDVSMSAVLVTSAPVLTGTIRNMSAEGMMIELAGQLPEGLRLLVKTRGSDVRMGRVQWSSGGMAGLFFETRQGRTDFD